MLRLEQVRGEMLERFERVDRRFAQNEQRLGRIDQRLAEIGQLLDGLREEIRAQRELRDRSPLDVNSGLDGDVAACEQTSVAVSARALEN